MSLSLGKYLITLPSERRQVARFHSVSVQDQLDRQSADFNTLFDMVAKLLDLHEEHGIIEYDPVTAEIITTSEDQQQPTKATKPKKDLPHPYL